MPNADYIPAKNADAASWATNFDDLVTANPTSYGLTAPIAVTIAAATAAFVDALAISTNPATRTTPTVAATQAARVDWENTVRPYAQQVKKNPAVTNEQRADLGLTIDATVPTPIPAPTAAPALELVSGGIGTVRINARNPETPGSKAKPFGATGLEIYGSIGTVAATDPSQATYLARATKSPLQLNLGAGNSGKVVTLFARFATTSGPAGVAQTGPFSAPLVFTLM